MLALIFMTQLLDLELEEGGSILVEVDEPVRGPVTRGRPAEAVTQAGESLERVLGRLGPAVRGIVSELRAAADWPDEVELEFAAVDDVLGRCSTSSPAIHSRSAPSCGPGWP